MEAQGHKETLTNAVNGLKKELEAALESNISVSSRCIALETELEQSLIYNIGEITVTLVLTLTITLLLF